MLTTASRLIREWFVDCKPRTPCRRSSTSAIVQQQHTELLEDRCLLSAGELDITFGDGGVTVTNVADSPVGWGVADTVVQPDGKILIVGTVASTTRDSQFNPSSPYSDGDNFDIVVARVLADGGANATSALDPSFGDNGILRLYVGPEYEAAGAIELLPDGKILIAGNTHGKASPTNYGIVIRLNTDGSRDSTFGDAHGVAWFADGPEWVTDMVVQSNGRIVVSGSDDSPFAGDDFELIAFTADGQPDLTFGTNGQVRTDVNNGTRNLPTQMRLLANDELLVVGTADWSSPGTAVVRYLNDGTLDTSFATDGVKHFVSDTMYDIVVMPDGRYLLGGGNGSAALMMMNSDGGLDSDFGNNGRVYHSLAAIGRRYSAIQKLHVLPDGRIQALLTTRDDYGYYYHAPSYASDVAYTYRTAVQLLSDGTLDSTFDGDGFKLLSDVSSKGSYGFLHGAEWLPDGKIVLPDQRWELSGIARFTETFDSDTTFNVDGDASFLARTLPSSDEAHGVTMLPSGQILVTGRSRGVEPRLGYGGWNIGGGALIERYDASGHLDTSFDAWLKEPYSGVGDGTVFPDLSGDPGRYEGGLIRDVVVRDDGTVFAPTLFDDRSRVYGVSIDEFGHAYYDWDRDVYDNTSDGAEIGGVVPLADGRIALAYRANGEGVVAIVREAGLADDTGVRYVEDLRWSTGDFIPSVIRISIDGHLLLTDGRRLEKYELNGNLLAEFEQLLPDQTFEIRDFSVQADGKIVVTGKLFAGTIDHIFAARWNTNGTVDTTFGVGGVTVSANQQPSEANAVVIQPNGRIVVFGNIGNALAAVAFTGAGLADETFGNHGTTQIVATDDALAHFGTALALQSDGGIVATGFITRDDGREDIVLLRLQGDNAVLTPTVTHVSPDTGRHDRDAVTNASQLTFHGTADAGQLVSVTVNGTAAGSVTATPDGTWSLDYSHVNPGEGTYDVVAVSSQFGQSSSPSEALSVIVDQTAPEPSVPEMRYDSQTPAGDNVIDLDSFYYGLRGFAELESSAYLYVNGQAVPANRSPGQYAWDIAPSKRYGSKQVGEWTIYDHINTVPFTFGKYAYATEVEDLAGNRSKRSDELVVWVVGAAGEPQISVTGNGVWSEDSVPPLVLTVDPEFHGTPELIWQGTATSGEDYVPSGLDFTQTNINTIDYHRDDTLYEPDESITVRRKHGDIRLSEDILITIQENDAPTLESIPDFTTVVGQAIAPVFVTVGNFAAGVDVPIEISVDNTTLFPAGSLVLSGAQSFRQLSITPSSGYLGTATITITAGHGNATVVESFVVTIQGSATTNTIVPLTDQSIVEDAFPIQIPITVLGINPGQVTVTAHAQNAALVAPAGLQVTGTEANRSLTITPTPDAFGTTLIALEAIDALGVRTLQTFSLDIAAVNDAPALQTTSDSLTLDEDTITALSTNNVPWIQVTDVDAGDVRVRLEAEHGDFLGSSYPYPSGVSVASSSNGWLEVTGPLEGANAYLSALRYVPDSNYHGPDMITVSAIDAAIFDVDYATSFISTSAISYGGSSYITGPPNGSDWYTNGNVTGLQTVSVGFDYPVFSDGAMISETKSGGFVQKVEAMDEAGNFTDVWAGVDPLTAPGELALTWPKTTFAVHGLRVTIDTDRPGYQGIDSIQLLGSHPQHPIATNDSVIAVTVTPINDAPKMTNLTNVYITSGFTGTRSFSLTDAESPVGDLQLQYTSSNDSLVPASGISFDTSGSTHKLIFSGTADTLGTSIVTVTATDPQGLSATVEFKVTVSPRSNYPSLTAPDTVATDEDVPISFMIGVEDERATSEQLEVWGKRISGPILGSIPVTGANAHGDGHAAGSSIRSGPHSGLRAQSTDR